MSQQSEVWGKSKETSVENVFVSFTVINFGMWPSSFLFTPHPEDNESQKHVTQRSNDRVVFNMDPFFFLMLHNEFSFHVIKHEGWLWCQNMSLDLTSKLSNYLKPSLQAAMSLSSRGRGEEFCFWWQSNNSLWQTVGNSWKLQSTE